jgi:hypothetical protein
MKTLQTLALGMAIGVLALLANTRPAAAAVAQVHHHHRAVPRLTRSNLASSARGNGSRSGSRSSHRPAPPPPSSRTATHQRAHQQPTRSRPDQQAVVPNVRGFRPQMVAWRIDSEMTLSRGFSDASVISERGPPSAGSQVSFAQHPRSASKLLSQPRPESQTSFTFQTSSSPQSDPSSSDVSFPCVRAFSVPVVFPQGLSRDPLRADRQEGTAAHLVTPSLGDTR